MKLGNLLKTMDEPVEPPCKGLFFRCEETNYRGGRGEIVYCRKMIPLKRMSCKGCSQCEYLHDFLKDDDYLVGGAALWDGKVYMLYCHSWQDYEGNHDSELRWVEVKPEETDAVSEAKDAVRQAEAQADTGANPGGVQAQ